MRVIASRVSLLACVLAAIALAQWVCHAQAGRAPGWGLGWVAGRQVRLSVMCT